MRPAHSHLGSGQPITDLAMLPMPAWPSETYPFEPVYGWIQRAAGANYSLSAQTFLGVLGLDGNDWDFDEQLDIVRQLPIDGIDQLVWNTPKRAPQGYEICGHRLSARLFCKGARRVCPRCLEDGRYIRVWFDIVPMASCPLHNMALIEGLEGDPLDWRSAEVGYTRNGVDLAGDYGTSQAASNLDSYIFDRLAGGQGCEPPHLAGQSLQSVIQAAVILARLREGVEARTPTPADLRRLAQSGFPALLNGREAIEDFLAEAPWLRPEFDKTRYRSRCHYAPQVTRTIPSESLRSLITESFGVVRVRNGLATPSGRLSQFDGEDGCWTLESAASALELERKYLRKLLRAVSMNPRRCAQTWAYRISAKDIAAVERYIATSLSSEAVAKMLGSTAADVDELVQRKALKMDFRRGVQRYFQQAEIANFVARVRAGRRDGLERKGTSLSDFATEAGISLPAAYSQLVRNKTIGLLDYDEKLPFFLAAKVAYFEKVRVRPGAQIKHAITFAKAKARLGTGMDGLNQLIELGHLKIVDDTGGQPRICGKSVDAFEHAYARAADYAPSLGCPPRSALKVLRKMGVEPINDYGKRSVSFVCRDDVRRLAGMKLESATGFQLLEALRDKLSQSFASESVPATVRVVSDPAVVMEATSRKWSFRILRKPARERYDLVALFRSPNEGRRLRKIEAASIEPSRIWPGAEVQYQAGGGFIIVDQVELEDHSAVETSIVVDRTVLRAHQLQRLL